MRNFLVVAFIALLSHQGLAERIQLPRLGIGVAGGYNDSRLGSDELNGAHYRLRMGYLFDTFPALFAALEGRIGQFDLSQSTGDISVDQAAVGAIAGFMIPLGLKGAPKNLGIPIYFGYDIFNELDIESSTEKIEGNGIRVGVMLPVPIPLPGGLGLSLDIAYQNIEYDPASFFGSREVRQEGVTYMLHFGLPLLTY